jgi:hypothetical protein
MPNYTKMMDKEFTDIIKKLEEKNGPMPAFMSEVILPNLRTVFDAGANAHSRYMLFCNLEKEVNGCGK